MTKDVMANEIHKVDIPTLSSFDGKHFEDGSLKYIV